MNIVKAQPPLNPLNEDPVSLEHGDILDCRSLFDDIVTEEIDIISMNSNYSYDWGYVFRIMFYDLDEEKNRISMCAFISWKKPGFPPYFSLFPVGDYGDMA